MNEFSFQELYYGQRESFCVTVTKELEDYFRMMTGDVNPLHLNDDFAQEVGNGKFRSHVTFGMLTASFYSTLVGVYLPGKYSLIHSLDIKFQKPVYMGDELTVMGEVTGMQEELKLIQIKATIKNQMSQKVSQADIKVLVMK